MPDEQRAAPAEMLVLSEASGDAIEVAKVTWIEARDYYAAVHTEEGVVHLVRRLMSSLARRLHPLGFVRTHRSALVNLEFVARVERAAGGRARAVLADGTICRVSRDGARSLRTAGVSWS